MCVSKQKFVCMPMYVTLMLFVLVGLQARQGGGKGDGRSAVVGGELGGDDAGDDTRGFGGVTDELVLDGAGHHGGAVGIEGAPERVGGRVDGDGGEGGDEAGGGVGGVDKSPR